MEIKKTFSVLAFAVTISVLVLLSGSSVKAGAITNIDVTPVSVTVGVTTDYSAGFTCTTAEAATVTFDFSAFGTGANDMDLSGCSTVIGDYTFAGFTADPSGVTVDNTAKTIAFTGGTVASPGAMTIDNAVAGTGWRIRNDKNAETKNVGVTTASDSGTYALAMVADVLDHFVVNAPATGIAATNFLTTITGQDQYNNTAIAGYGGDVALTVDAGTITPTTIAQAQFTDDGVWTNNIQLSNSGDRTITATGNTKTGQDTVTISPAAITTLACVASGQAGSVIISWTVPAGTSNNYQARYSLAAIDDDATYNGATNYAAAATWANGTVSQANWNLVLGLSPNAIYWFGMKAQGADATISAIPTNLPVSCTAPAAGGTTYSDLIAPTSLITNPAHGSTILANQPYTIKGTAMDTGGSSVQKVEVSLDGGTNWNLATIKDNANNNALWEYIWQNPIVGSYTIKTRAADWMGNVETPGTGITVTVATTLPTPTPPTTPTIEKPISQMTVTEIQAKIAEIQQTLISLLQQLIQVIQQQIQALLSASHS